MKNLWTSIARTLCPAIVGFVLAWVSTTGLELDPEFSAALTGVLFVAFDGAYYLVARLLEQHVSPKFGWLLGVAKAPEYDADTVEIIEEYDFVIEDGTGKHRAGA